MDFADIKAVISHYQPTIWQDFGNIHPVLLLNQVEATPIVFAVHAAIKRKKAVGDQLCPQIPLLHNDVAHQPIDSITK